MIFKFNTHDHGKSTLVVANNRKVLSLPVSVGA